MSKTYGQEVAAVPDVYATIADVDVEMQERLAGILELRAADPQQQMMLDSYLSEIEFPPEAGRRAEADEFYGFIGFASFIARKP
jgi:hypothetical protein